MTRIFKTKINWNITSEVNDAIEICRKNPDKMATIQVPNTMVRLAAEMMLNELSMYDEAACRVNVEQATVH
jgi:hypothetical protein